MAALATTTVSTVGKPGRQRRASTSSAKLPTPKAMDGQCTKGGVSTVSQPEKPSRAGSCEAMMSTAAACVKAMSTGELTRLSNQPKRAKPSTICSSPVSSASHTASSIQRWLPGSAKPVSEAPTSRQVRAVGPTDSRGEALKSTAISAGSSDA